MELNLAKLAATESIRTLKFRYAQLCDEGYDPDLLSSLFTHDAVWLREGDRPCSGRARIRDFFAGSAKRIEWALHYMMNPAIEVDDDLKTARGQWLLLQPASFRTTAGTEAVWITGKYEDIYRMVGGKWFFASVKLALHSATPYDQGWVKQRFRS